MSFFKDTNIFLAFFRILLACVAGGRGCARETFCGEYANSLAGVIREGIVASGEALAKLELKIRVRLLLTLLGTEVRAGTHSRRLRRLAFCLKIINPRTYMEEKAGCHPV